MTFEPFWTASPVVQIHAVAALLSLGVGGAVLSARKGTAAHKTAGWIWIVLMAATAVSSFWIVEVIPGSFSPIHILSVVTLVSLALAVWRRRKGDIKGHARAMQGAFYGLLGAGLFTMLPGRVIGRMLFGP